MLVVAAAIPSKPQRLQLWRELEKLQQRSPGHNPTSGQHDNLVCSAQRRSPPSEGSTVLFYDDELKVAIMRSHPAEDPAVFMPVCPPCDFLGVAWTAQRLRRYRRECSRALSAAFGATPTLAEALMEAMVNATLAGHDLEPISPAGDEHTSGYVAACWLCGRTVWVEKSGLLYSLLAEQCPFAIIGKQAS